MSATLPAPTLRPNIYDEALEAACEGAGESTVQPLTEYQERPLDFMVDVLGVERHTLVWSENEGYGHDEFEWDGDRDPFVQALDALVDWKDVGIESGTGTGKTYWLACVIFWFLGCFEDSIVVTAAPKEDQLLDRVWKEVERLWPAFQREFPSAELMASGRIRMRPEGTSRTWQAYAEVTGVREGEEVATKAQGEHAEHMLIITEETPGIHPAVMKAFENTRTAPHNLQVSVGNPDSQEDELHQFCLLPTTVHLRVSALDHPNVVCDDPTVVLGAVSTKKVVERDLKYADNRSLYDSRVRGISPKQAFGVALNFNEADHLKSWQHSTLVQKVEDGWPVVAALDLGDWRTSLLVGLVDRIKRMHVVREQFVHEADYDEVAELLHETLDGLAAPASTRVIVDRKDAHSVRKLNKALNRLDSPYKAAPVAEAAKARKASVLQINTLLSRGALLVRRELGQHLEWRLGLSIASQGESKRGSRLRWEMAHWRYPKPREGQAQEEDPDDDTADGADAIAALRYMVMSWYGPAKWEKEDRRDPHRDYGLEDLFERNEKRKKAEARQFIKSIRRRRR